MNIVNLFLHQEKGIENILSGNNTIVASGTGSGKTEIFLAPILDYCIQHRHEKGVKAIIVYPMNALANDQVERLRRILYPINKSLDKKITFAIYTGETPESINDLKDLESIQESCPLSEELLTEVECPMGCDRKQFFKKSSGGKSFLVCGRNPSIVVDYQPLTRSEIREDPPDILITNYVQLEYLLLRDKDFNIFSSGNVKYIVLDEVHSYSGARGIDVSLLIRRLRGRLKYHRNPEPVCIGTSATISRREKAIERKEEIAEFASGLFGVDFGSNDVVEGEVIEPKFDMITPIYKLTELKIPTNWDDLTDEEFRELCDGICPSARIDEIGKDRERGVILGSLLMSNPFFQHLLGILEEPRDIKEIIDLLLDTEELKDLLTEFKEDERRLKDVIWSYLKVASMSLHPNRSLEEENPLIRINVHNFYKTIEDIYVCLKCERLYTSPRDKCEKCDGVVERFGVCRFCGKEFLITKVLERNLEELLSEKQKSNILATIGETTEKTRLKKQSYTESFNVIDVWQSFEDIEKKEKRKKMKKCLCCGAILLQEDDECVFCGSVKLKKIYVISDLKPIKIESGEIRNKRETQPHNCPFCNNSYGRFSALSPVLMSSNTASAVLFNEVYASLPKDYRKLLIFTDNRQAASYLAGFLEDDHLNHAIRNLLRRLLIDEFDGRATYQDIKEESMDTLRNWYGGDFEGYDLDEIEIKRKIDNEIASTTGVQRSIENLGLVEMTYFNLEDQRRFNRKLDEFISGKHPSIDLDSDKYREDFRKYLITFLNLMRTNGALSTLKNRYWWERDNATGYLLREGAKKIHSPHGVELKNVLSKGKIFKFTQRVFGMSKEVTEDIIKFSFDFLIKYNLIVKKQLKKGKSEPAEGYAVNAGKMVMKIPEEIWKCEKCKRAYTNIPRNVCPTWLCDGITERIAHDDFLAENVNYYFNLYKDSNPIRMVTKEDTGALETKERHEIELQFKSEEFDKRKVDVVVATPTLELGVDIGDLLSIGLFKAPPSPANYLQRVGRAGRKEKISFNNTFLFLTPIDMFYYRSPQELIKGEVSPPFINLKNKNVIARHVNSIILEDLLVHSPNAHQYPDSNLIYEFIQGNFFDGLCSDFKNRRDEIRNKVSYVLRDLNSTDDDIEDFIGDFIPSVETSIIRFNKELERLKSRLQFYQETPKGKDKKERQLRWKRKEAAHEEMEKLKYGKNILQHFMDTNIIPRYAFPGVYVEISEQFDRENFGSRSKNIALTEFVPGIELYLRKHIYKSIGIDFKFIAPDKKEFYVCKICNTYISKDNFNFCPLCKKRTQTNHYECISPEVIFLKRTNKSINEPREYQEAKSDIFLSTKKMVDSRPLEGEDNLVLTKYGNIDITKIVSGLIIEDNGILEEKPLELCNKCGKIRKGLSETKHKELGGKDFCSGRFEEFKLFHTMPTNVISIKITGESLFGIPVEIDGIFLTTLKNAIINAAQILIQAADGEIEGMVKGDELILFDNVDGGVGYVDEIYGRFEEILQLAGEKFVLNPEDNCEKGCLKCLHSYRRKRDIKNIDKRVIIPIFEKIKLRYCKSKLEEGGGLKETFAGCIGKNIRTIYSPTYNLSGVIELKNLLQTAKEQIKITSLYVTDDKINWVDEGRRSWVDILLSIKLNPTKDVKILVIVREPATKSHKKALKRLIESGIEVKVFKNDTLKKFPAIVHSKLIVIDPYDPDARYAIHTSANFSPEMWKNHDTYDFGDDEEWVMCTDKEISKLEKESSNITIKELEIVNGLDTQILKPGEILEVENIEKIGIMIGNARKEIKILDPYLTRVNETFNFLAEWSHKDIDVKILTAKTDSKVLKRSLEKVREGGYTIDVIRYFDRERITGQETLLHDRYIIIDNETVIELGKGLNTLFETKGNLVKTNVTIRVFTIVDEVQKFVENFNDFWNYTNSENKIIEEFPKELY